MAVSTIRFLGAAQDVSDIWTYTIGGTPAATNTVWLELNNKRLTLTVGTDVTTTDVAQELAAMINAKTNTMTTKVGATTDETWSAAGQTYPEWTEVSATSSGAVLTLTSTPGVPIQAYMTVGVTGGGATISPASSVQTATGKNFVDNADNWEGGVLPSNDSVSAGDTILADNGIVDMKYALDAFDSEDNINLVRTLGYGGSIGLPLVNPLGYAEYRQRFLNLPATTGTGDQLARFGNPGIPGRGTGFTRLNLGSVTGAGFNIYAYESQARTTTGEAAIQIIGTVTEVGLVAHRASVDICMDETAGQVTMNNLATSWVENEQNDCDVKIGYGVDWGSSDQIDIRGGMVLLKGGMGPPAIEIHSGTLILDTVDQSVGVVHVFGGTVQYVSGVFVPTIYDGGTVDFRASTNLMTSGSQPVFYKGYRYYDPRGNVVWTNGIDFVGCVPGSSGTQVFDVIPNRNWLSAAV